MKDMKDTVRAVIKDLAKEFMQDPYLCYTEHGLHALLYTMLYNALPAKERYLNWGGQKVCVIQKEYPTAARLGASRRSNWDIAVIKKPPESLCVDKTSSYDYLHLAAVAEIGMNATEEHLRRDIERLCHRCAKVDHRFAVHLYRLSDPLFSQGDWSPRSKRIVSKEKAAQIVEGKDVEVLYGMHDSSGQYGDGVWLINGDSMTQLV